MRKRFFLLSVLSLIAMLGVTVTGYAQEKALSAEDKEFMMKAASGGMMEVELGNSATKKAASQDVKDFGKQMVTDHGKVNDELKNIAKQKNVTLPSKMNAKHKETVDKLSKLSGAEFDKKYMSEMVKDHVKDVSEFEAAVKKVKDPALNGWAKKTLPTLKKHLERAKDIAYKLGVDVHKD